MGNLGGSDENVSVTVCANSTVIASSNLFIQAGNMTTSSLPYNGQTLAAGTYRLEATVSPVPQESCAADNTVTGDVITVPVAIPEFGSPVIMASLLVIVSALTLAFKRKEKLRVCIPRCS